tara:strand:+ start:797 stop:1057 length:261 start_codon:yes stop_codon:yes gene_type:complete
MRKQSRRRKGKLIQNVNNTETTITRNNIFTVIATKTDLSNAWVENEQFSFKEAKEYVDSRPKSNINYYIYGTSNRVLYSKKGENDA